MSHLIVVSNGYIDLFHGPWASKELAEQTAERWNRVYKKRGWPLTAHVQVLLGKRPTIRDKIGASLAEMAEQSRVDELARLDAIPCECFAPDVDPDTVTDETPDGVCACGHVPDEHDGDGQCDAMILPDTSTS
jgi:hypothetical protein